MARIINKILNNFGLVIFLLLAWEISSRLIIYKGYINNAEILFPPLSSVLKEAVVLIQDKVIFMHLLMSLKRVMVGFGLSVLFAVPLGLILSLSKRWARQAEPIIECIRFIPPVAWIPISILWFGISEPQQYFIIFIGTFTTIFTTIFNEANSIPKELECTALCLGASRLNLILKVIIPATLSGIFLGMRLGLGLAWYLIVASEFVSASSGLGYLILEGRNIVNTQLIFVGMIIIGLISFLSNSIILKIKNLILPWTRKDTEISGIFESRQAM